MQPYRQTCHANGANAISTVNGSSFIASFASEQVTDPETLKVMVQNWIEIEDDLGIEVRA